MSATDETATFESPQFVALCSGFALIVLVLQLGTLSQPSSIHASSLLSENLKTQGYLPVPSPSNPIILLGLPSSGSQTLHEYFQCHGLTSAHYCCGTTSEGTTTEQVRFPCVDEDAPTCGDCILKNLQNHRHAFEACGPKSAIHGSSLVQVWSQFDLETSDQWFLPQHFALGLLHETYPNATWILNTREKSMDWAESVFRWQSQTRRILSSFGLPVLPPEALAKAPDSKDEVSAEEIEIDMERQLLSRVYNRTEHLRKVALLDRIYRNHTATIHNWASHFPSHPFLYINVDDDLSLSILDEAFGFDSVGFGAGKCHWSFENPNDDWRDFDFEL